MSATLAVTRNVPGRFRGFFASCMLEVGPGIYVAPDMKKSVRTKILETLFDWQQFLPQEAGVLFLWKDPSEPSGLQIHMIGLPTKNLTQYQGLWLINQSLTETHDRTELEQLQGPKPAGEDDQSETSDVEHVIDRFIHEYDQPDDS